MPQHAVVEALVCQEDEVIHGFGGVIVKERDLDHALAGDETGEVVVGFGVNNLFGGFEFQRGNCGGGLAGVWRHVVTVVAGDHLWRRRQVT